MKKSSKTAEDNLRLIVKLIKAVVEEQGGQKNKP